MLSLLEGGGGRVRNDDVAAGGAGFGAKAAAGDCGEWRPGVRKFSNCGMLPSGDSERLLPADRLLLPPHEAGAKGEAKSAGDGGGCSEFVVLVVDDATAVVVVVVVGRVPRCIELFLRVQTRKRLTHI